MLECRRDGSITSPGTIASCCIPGHFMDVTGVTGNTGIGGASKKQDQNIYGSSSSSSETAEVSFNLTEIAGHWKSGLIIKGAILRPK
ncbi:hypothetical protein WN944_019563 [Citrus x changshan-huyou]|uniref:Uncharacterized protein n=1 Tax=Citrus x changshan-huyou TaxID=2935761 RepID=A0AAP0QGH5_9ROSI